MSVEDMSGDQTLFIMTRHPSSACACDGSCKCSSDERTWIGSCSNGLITMTKQLSHNDEEPGPKDHCTGVISLDSLYIYIDIECAVFSERYGKLLL